jgi:hypothetical protein
MRCASASTFALETAEGDEQFVRHGGSIDISTHAWAALKKGFELDGDEVRSEPAEDAK